MNDERIQSGIALLHREAARKIEEWNMTGPMVNEVFVDWQPPLVEYHAAGDVLVFTERLRFL